MELPAHGSPPLVVRYGDEYAPGSFRLVECPDEVLQQLTAEGEGARLWIRGEASDEAVLCTRDATFAMRDAELSNSLLLVHPLPAAKDTPPALVVHDSLGGVIELARIPPRLSKLTELLTRQPYKGPAAEATVRREDLLTLDKLLSLVQASDAELHRGLDDVRALLIDGYYRILEPAYLDALLTAVVQCAAINRWSHESLAVQECAEAVLQSDDAFPVDVVRHTLLAFADEGTEPASATVRLSRTKVCRYVAERLLVRHRVLELRALREAWQQAVAPLFQIDDELLCGLGLIEGNVTDERTVKYFPASQLPLEPLARFQRLFETRARWTHADLVPYVRPIADSNIHLDTLLLRYTRPFTESESGQRMYSARF